MNEIRLAILGEGGVGKSAITIQFLQNHFVEIYDPTIEDSYRKQIMVDDHTYHVEILDTAGQEEYTAMRDQYMRTADGFVIVYDITNYRSFLSVSEFVDRIRMNRPDEKVGMVVCGNKCDLFRQKSILPHDVKKLEMSLKCPVYECSAKSYINIDEVWHDVIRQVTKIKFSKYTRRRQRNSYRDLKSCQIL